MRRCHVICQVLLLGAIETGLAAQLGDADAGNRFRVQEVDPVSVADIPGVVLRSPEHCLYAALQFGPTDKHVLYLVADCAGKGGRHDRLFAYVPDDPVYGETKRLTGSWRKGQSSYRGLRLKAEFDGARVEYNLSIAVDSDWSRNKAEWLFEADCSVSAGAKRRRYQIGNSKLVNMARGDLLSVLRMIDEPELNVSWDRRSEPPCIRCSVMTGDFHADIGKQKAGLVIKDPGGDVVLDTSFRLRPEGNRYETKYQLRRTPKAGGLYEALMSVDLAPVFGVTTGRDSDKL